MSTDSLIPAAVQLAAKRGFIRTASQSLATGFAVPGALTLVFTGDGLLALGVGVAGLVFNAVVNGAQSALNIVSNGIPKDYADVTLVTQAVVTQSEAIADQESAVQRVYLRRDLKNKED
jgi:hypothetical protein